MGHAKRITGTAGGSPLYPFLLAIWPILCLYSRNPRHIAELELYAPIVAAVVGVVFLWGVFLGIFRDRMKATMASCGFWLLFFSYGESARSLGELPVSVAYILILALLMGALKRTRLPMGSILNAVGLLSIALIVMPGEMIANYEIRKPRHFQRHIGPIDTAPQPAGNQQDEFYPNIYYIILDGYGREDVLRDLYQYDNTEMTRFLTDKGFHVVRDARANYCQTALSMSSSLNGVYLDGLVAQIGEHCSDRYPPRTLIEQNRVAEFLRRHGYQTAVIESGYNATEMPHADIRLGYSRMVTEFEFEVLRLTPMPHLSKAVCLLLRRWNCLDYYEVSRRQITYALERLGDPASTDRPVFVFAHIVAPHPPFVLGPNGEPVECGREFTHHDGSNFIRCGGTKDEYIRGYSDQLSFVNSRLKIALTDLLSASERPAIVILQSDHGPGSRLDWERLDKTDCRERLAILQAFHFPDFDYRSLPDDITPVNTFRVIFNHYFGTDYPLLENRSYYSRWSRPYQFVDVTRSLDGNGKQPLSDLPSASQRR